MARLDTIPDLLSFLEIPFWEGGQHRHVTSGWYGIDCPTCSPSSGRAKLGINSITLVCNCWTCGPTRLGTALAEITGRPLREILAVLPGRNETLPADYRQTTGKYTPPPGVGPLLPAHRKYLRGRGIDPDYAATVWGVQGIGHDGGTHKWRLFLPSFDKGKPVSWTTRAVGTDPVRYRAAGPAQEARPLKSLLFGAHLCAHACVLVEGPLTAIWAGKGFVASCGTAVTPAQVRALARFPVRAICLDAEPAAQRAARKLSRELSLFPGDTFIVQTSGKSPDLSPPDELAELRSRFLT